MSEKPSSIRLWLARYKPDRVRCTLRDGSLRELPKPTTARGQWAQLERAIVTLAPSYLEAFQGETCVSSRGLDTDDDDDDGAAPGKEETNPLAALVKTLPIIVGLIVDAGDASALRHQAAYELAFAKQLELVKILSDRLGGLERAWHKMILDRAAAQGGDENDGAAMSVIGEIIRGRVSGPNGAAPPKVDE